MKKFALITLSFVVLICALAYWYFSPSKPPSYQAFINAHVLTMDADNRIAEAVLVHDNTIVAVGSNDEIKQKMPSSSMVHDLNGASLMPGIIDAHSHYPASGFSAVASDLNSPPIGTINSIPELLSSLKKQAGKTKKSAMVFGYGYDDTNLKEHRHPSIQELDSISTEQAIFILHISAHMGVANSKALEMMGITNDSPNPEGGVIEKDAQGNLTGLLQETAMRPMFAKATDFSLTDKFKIINQANKDYTRVGVTTAQSGGATKKQIDGLYSMSRLNLIPMRLEVWPLYSDASDDILSGEYRLDNPRNERFHLGAMKIIVDGSIQGYTGFLSKPYFVQPENLHGQTAEQYVAYPTIQQAKLNDIVMQHYKIGTHLAIHGNGDGAIDSIIDAVQLAQTAYPQADARTILIHAQMARQDQLNSMLELGISPSFYSAHTYYWGDRHRDIFMGPERAANMSPAKSALDKGLPFTIHLDTPVVPMNPMLLVWTAVNRQSTSGAIIGPEQRISAMQALRATTIDAAWQIFRENEIGSIEAGKLADLIILDGNPLADNASIKDIKVDQTFVGGVSVFKRN